MLESVNSYSHDIILFIITGAISLLAKSMYSLFVSKGKDISRYNYEDISWDKKAHAISRFNTLYFSDDTILEKLELRFISNFLTHRNEAHFCYALLNYITLKNININDTLKLAREHSGLIRVNKKGCTDLVRWRAFFGLFLLIIFSVALGVLLPLQISSLCNIFINYITESRVLALFKVTKSFSWLFSFLAIYIACKEIISFRKFTKLIRYVNLAILMDELRKQSSKGKN
ncbi:hypothetical protein [Yersinia aldovae]|uniref:hypothetical protein n=1 Tax=Yersinia aldovae TaxID=29483 RepID=UPI0011A62C27|nr:hypothetical protein [Yersinia aldovae]